MTLDGNKLRHGQNKWSAETRIWSEAQTKAKRLDLELQALLEGKPVRQNVTVRAAVDKWLASSGGAFGGGGSGRQERMASNRGRASMGSGGFGGRRR